MLGGRELVLSGVRGWVRVIAPSLCALGCSLIVGAGEAHASESQFGEPGSGPGRFAEPFGIAANQTTGDVYVADRNNQRVDEFGNAGEFLRAWGWGVADGTTDSLQTCTESCFGGIRGSGSGEFEEPEGVAVDNSTNPLDTSVGDVYVVDLEDRRVEKFGPEGTFILMFGGQVNVTKVEEKAEGKAVSEAEENLCTAASGDTCGEGHEGTGPGQFGTLSGTGVQPGLFIAVDSLGTVYVGDVNRIEEFNPEGEYQAEIPLPGAGKVTALAVSANGDVYVESQAVSGVREYESGNLIDTLDASGTPEAVALDASGDVFVDDESSSGGNVNHRLLEYGSGGSELDSFDSGREGGFRGIAFSDAADVVYVLNSEAVRVVTPPSPGPVIQPSSESASPVGPSSATLRASVDSEGHETHYHFEYGTSASYGESTAETPIGASFEDQSAEAALTELQLSTTYHFRVVATNSAGTAHGPDQTFETQPPALIDSESAANVTSSSATLFAEIDPLGADTKYTFEYGITSDEETKAPLLARDVGSGESDVAVSQHVEGLAAGAVYHYRVVATNARGSAPGPNRTFTTQPGAGALTLPDGRAWELVSPAQTDGAGIEALTKAER